MVWGEELFGTSIAAAPWDERARPLNGSRLRRSVPFGVAREVHPSPQR